MCLLDYPMSNNYQSLFLLVPESKQPVSCFVIQSAELPDFRILQFLEQLGVSLPADNPLDIYSISCKKPVPANYL